MRNADMVDNLLPSGPIDLDALDDYLMSERSPEDSMGVSHLDGFLTGIVIGPEFILPSEWLPVVWGGEEPAFKTEEEMRLVLGTIMGRYNEIVDAFNGDPIVFDPIFWEAAEGVIITSDWAAGFLDAVALRRKSWVPLISDDRAGILLVPFFMLNGNIESEDDAEEYGVLVEAAKMIPTSVAGIHEFWKTHVTRSGNRTLH
jgi:uncharacterized protein